MYPTSFSFLETYTKHRNPDEIREMERRDQVQLARAYRYGDPVNTKEQEKGERANHHRESRLNRKPNHVYAFLRSLLFVLQRF